VLERSRVLLERREGDAAARLLEDALADATNAERPPILQLLAQAYREAAQQSLLRNDAHAAASARSNLAIVELRLREAKSLEPTRNKESEPAARPASPSQNASSAPVPALPRAALPSEPAPLPAPSESDTAMRGQSVEVSPVIEIPSMARAAPPATRTDPTVDTEVQRAAVVSPAPEARESPKAQDRESAGAEAAVTAPMDSPEGAESNALLVSADQAFRDKRYEDAGRAYAQLDREKTLPASRREVWAYCRRVAVVGRINEKPQTLEEWNSILAEIESIRALCPRHWYDEYLRNLVREMTSKIKASSRSRPIVRGASPEPAESSPRVERAFDSNHNWQVLRTPNFLIHHHGTTLAREAAEVVEAARTHLVEKWAGRQARGSWDPPCSIYLFPSEAAFESATGQPGKCPGYSTTSLSAGRVVARRINARADAANLLTAVLPHEVTHIVLADVFPDYPIPRWADEGIAALSEPDSEQVRRDADLVEPMQSNKLFGIDQLLVIDYPESEHWPLYYAQSIALVRFLVERSGPATFIEYLQRTRDLGADKALERCYAIRDRAELQRLWLAHLRERLDLPAASLAGLADDRPAALK
jgi:hypothetical protein